ncbi:MAG: YceD family protein [Gammaproteobacteria bacterium]|nr:YceD family protein [Gammaproteobacteria bacterium]
MNTREHERLSYLDLAKRSARVTRRIGRSELPRFSQLVDSSGIVEVELAFALDDNGHAWVTGCAEVEIGLVCHRCSETLNRTVRAQVSACLVADEQLATVLGADQEVLVTDGTGVTAAEIVEDELILSLPERLCEHEPCELTPEFNYPASGDERESEQDNEANPFSVLAGLKTQNRDL